MNERLEPQFAAGVQQVHGPRDVGLDQAASAGVGAVRRHVKDPLRAHRGDDPLNAESVGEVDGVNNRVHARGRQPPRVGARADQQMHLVPVTSQPQSQVRADESGAAGDEDALRGHPASRAGQAR